MSELFGFGEHAVARFLREPFSGLPGEVAHGVSVVPVHLHRFRGDPIGAGVEEVGDDDMFFHR